MKRIFKEIMSYVFIALAVILFRSYILTPAVVDGDSMNSVLNDHDLVIINKISLVFNDINRFDIVVLNNKIDNDRIIKRIIGLPNEKIEYKNNKLYINGKEINTPINFEETEDFVFETKDDEYFVLGDNRDISKDSRYLGNFKFEDIVGIVNVRFYPFDKIGIVE